jgi:hypothetical protein
MSGGLVSDVDCPRNNALIGADTIRLIPVSMHTDEIFLKARTGTRPRAMTERKQMALDLLR